jgi:uncharacterized protein YwqG
VGHGGTRDDRDRGQRVELEAHGLDDTGYLQSVTQSDRRSFFKQLARGMVEVAQEVSGAMRDLDLDAEPIEPWTPPRPVPATPTERTATAADLEQLVREVGLERRLDDALRLARPSIRLTPAEGPATPGASRLGGAPDAPAGLEWPTVGDRQLAFVGQLRLADVAGLVPDGPLPREGLLLLFWDATGEPNGLSPGDRGSCRALVVDDDPAALEPRTDGPAPYKELPVELSRELTLPRQWHSVLEALDLDGDEFVAWDELRTKLAAFQGVELEEVAADWHALHRLLGWPEEVGGEMELDCQLATNGVDLGKGAGYADDRAEELRSGAPEWRLLFQLSADDDLGTTFNEGFGRLYLWLRDQDLQGGNFDAAWAILQ